MANAERLVSLDLEGTFVNNPGETVRPFKGFVSIGESSGRFVGSLKDVYGSSDIIGGMDDRVLSFVKLYKLPAFTVSPIGYKFMEAGEGLWQGSYLFDELNYSVTGAATCKTASSLVEPIALDEFERIRKSLKEQVERRHKETVL